MISANEARAFSELARLVNRNKSIETISAICENANQYIIEAVEEGKNSVNIPYPREVFNSQFVISDLRQIAKEYFGQYGYEATVPSGEGKIKVRW